MDELDCRTFFVVVAESHSLSLDIEAQWTPTEVGVCRVGGLWVIYEEGDPPGTRGTMVGVRQLPWQPSHQPVSSPPMLTTLLPEPVS